MVSGYYVNEAVRKMYGIPLSQLTPEQREILRQDGIRRAKLIDERQKDFMRNNKRAFEDAEKLNKVLASIYGSCQKEILGNVAETIAKVKKAGGEWSYANQSALTRSRGLFEQINKELIKLGKEENTVFRTNLQNIYTDQFLRTVYTLGQTQTVKSSFNMLNPRLIQDTLDYPWSGAMFSDRLWLDKDRLGRNLRVGLTQSMILGEDMDRIADRVGANINTSKYNAMRVARTETKRVTYSSQAAAFEDQNVGEVRYMAANNGGDSRTCDLCREDHGKVYKLGEEPSLPRHPNCRCWYIPVVKDTFEDNELNELTGSVRGAENYEKWKEKEADKIIEAQDPKVAPKVSENEEKYNRELSKLDNDYKAKNLEIIALRDEQDRLETQYKSFAPVRRGLLDFSDLGFKDREAFEEADRRLFREKTEIITKINKAQTELKLIMADREYLLKVGAEKIDSLEDYRFLKNKIVSSRTFDYALYGDDLIEAISKMSAKDIALQKEFFSRSAIVDWTGVSPLEIFKDGAISDIRILAQSSKVTYNKVEKLKKAVSESEIIDKLAGGDMTTGSCASLAFAYAANKSGFDVTDFRGGSSQKFFASYPHIKQIMQLPGIKGKIVKVKKEAIETASLLKDLEIGKEFYLAVGKHAAVVKNTDEGLMYLELQSGRVNGWKPFTEYGSVTLTLQKRFGCKKTINKFHGVVYESEAVLMEVDSFKNNPEFIKMMGYVNTATDKQKKGAAGSVK